MLKNFFTPSRLVSAALVAVLFYAVAGAWVGYNMQVCWAEYADNGKDCVNLYFVNSFYVVGLAIFITVMGVALATRELRSRTLLENAFYNTKTGTLTLVFSKPVTLSNRWNLKLVDDVRTYLEIGIGNNIEGETFSVRGEPNSRILELAAPPGVRDQIQNAVRNNRHAHIILAIPPDTIHFTSPLADVTVLNGGRTLHADIDIIYETRT